MIPDYVGESSDLATLFIASLERGDTKTLETLFQKESSSAIGKIVKRFSSDPSLRNAATYALSNIDLSALKGVILRLEDAPAAQIIDVLDEKTKVKLTHNAPDELIKKVIDGTQSRKKRQAIVSRLPIYQQKTWTDYLIAQDKLLSDAANASEDGLSSIIDERLRTLGELDAVLAHKKAQIFENERDAEARLNQLRSAINSHVEELNQINEASARRESELLAKEKQVESRLKELEEEAQRRVQEKIEAKVPEYVQQAVGVLERREDVYRKQARYWSIQGVAVLTLAIASAAALTMYGYMYGEALKDVTWQTMLFITFKGLIILSVLGLWAKHAFTVSNAYMHEAIKRADRAHAINFGKLYLEIYGNTVDRKELLEIFENWNIASESAFSKINPDGFDAKVIDKMVDVVKTVEKITKAPGKDKD